MLEDMNFANYVSKSSETHCSFRLQRELRGTKQYSQQESAIRERTLYHLSSYREVCFMLDLTILCQFHICNLYFISCNCQIQTLHVLILRQNVCFLFGILVLSTVAPSDSWCRATLVLIVAVSSDTRAGEDAGHVDQLHPQYPHKNSLHY